MNQLKQTAMSVAVAMLFCASAAHAVYTPVVTTTNNNLTVVSPGNLLTGGTNDVTFTWDGTYRTSVVTDNTFNATLSSPTAFATKTWTMHNVNIYAPGNYVFYTGCPAGNPACGVGSVYNMTVGIGQIGAHMLQSWSSTNNVDVVLLWDMNKSWAGTGTTSAYCTGSGANCNGSSSGNTINTVWDAVSIDTNMDPDSFSGTKMIDGPTVGWSWNFNINGIQAVPVPTSLWLFGSGLLGFIGLARRKAA
ncbi:PEP-CTERM sorting domain-containing protein [Sulfurirhabdus autotrophica]|nr:PEP-CTERM sorting domain-containing protein [Sulfurirhabdus autotrophica]